MVSRCSKAKSMRGHARAGPAGSVGTRSAATDCAGIPKKGSEQFTRNRSLFAYPAVPRAAGRVGNFAGGEADRADAARGELVGRSAVKMHAENQGCFAAQALREEGAEDPREHVAH